MVGGSKTTTDISDLHELIACQAGVWGVVTAE